MELSYFDKLRNDIVDVLRSAIYYGHGHVVANRRARLRELNAAHPEFASVHAVEDERLLESPIGLVNAVTNADTRIGISGKFDMAYMDYMYHKNEKRREREERGGQKRTGR